MDVGTSAAFVPPPVALTTVATRRRPGVVVCGRRTRRLCRPAAAASPASDGTGATACGGPPKTTAAAAAAPSASPFPSASTPPSFPPLAASVAAALEALSSTSTPRAPRPFHPSLAAALAAGAVLCFGRAVPVALDGSLVLSGATTTPSPPPPGSPAAAAAAAVAASLGNRYGSVGGGSRLAGVYVRGSAAGGCFLPGRSDVDVLAYVADGGGGGVAARARRAAATAAGSAGAAAAAAAAASTDAAADVGTVGARPRGVTRVEVRVHGVTAAAYAAGTVPDAPTLAAWAAHIAGTDVRAVVRGHGGHPPVAVDDGAAAAAAADVVRSAAAAARATTDGGRLAPARWAAKRLLRGAAAVAAPTVGWTSRDLLPCAVAAATMWPARAGEVAALVQLAALGDGDEDDAGTAAAAVAWAWGGGLADAAAWVEAAWVDATFGRGGWEGVEEDLATFDAAIRGGEVPPGGAVQGAPAAALVRGGVGGGGRGGGGAGGAWATLLTFPWRSRISALVGGLPTWATAASSSPFPTNSRVVTDALPPLYVTPQASVTRVCAEAFADSPPPGWTAAPLLLTGGCAGIFAAHPRLPTTLTDLAASPSAVTARVSPTATFVYTNPAHPAVVAGSFTPPSVVVTVPAAEFVARTTPAAALTDDDGESRGGGAGHVALPPLYPHPHSGGKGERVYAQTDATALAGVTAAALLRPLGLDAVPAGGAAAAAAAAVAGTSTPRTHTAVIPAQSPRLWVSTPGTVSATHLDAGTSYLGGLAGTKRLVLFPPGAIDVYPSGHPLARRARQPLAVGGGGEGPAGCERLRTYWASGRGAVEALVGPGDVLLFPAGWAHYTESVGVCFSLTCRFVVGEPGSGGT